MIRGSVQLATGIGRPLPRPLKIPGVMDLKSLADVRDLLKHIPAERRRDNTWQHVEAELKKAAAGGDAAQLSIALQMVLSLERVDYQTKEAAN